MSGDDNDIFEKMKKYVEDNPYPSYQEILKILKDNKEEDLYYNYDEWCHAFSERIYEVCLDEKITKSLGRIIYKFGGDDKLFTTADVFIRYGPFSSREQYDWLPYASSNTLQRLWDGIGTFRH